MLSPSIITPNDTITELVNLFQAKLNFEPSNSIFSKNKTKILKGLKGSSLSLLLCAIGNTKPIVFIANDIDDAAYIYNDLDGLVGENNVLFFPSSYKRAIKYGHKDEANIVLRAITLSAISNSLKTGSLMPIIITYPEAIAESVISIDSLKQNNITIEKNQRICMQELIDHLVSWGYKRVDYVYDPGQFAVRGSILDLFNFSKENPYRIDFFDMEIDSIRMFEVESQLSISSVDQITIIPDISNFVGQSSLFSILSDQTQLFSRDGISWKERIEYIYNDKPIQENDDSFKNLSEMRSVLLPPITIISEEKRFSRWQIIGKEDYNITFNIDDQPIFDKNLSDFFSFLNDLIGRKYNIYISTKDKLQYDRIIDIIKDRELLDNSLKEIKHIPISLHSGFIDNNSLIAVFTDHQLFNRYHKYNLRSDKVRSGKITFTLKDLNTFSNGDYVVHIDHGIGQFAGLMTMYHGKNKQEVVKLIYKGGDTVYVNLYNLHKLSHYKSRDTIGNVTLSTLGSGAWYKLKERAKTKVKDIARDLIKLYRARMNSSGFAFSPDSYLQHEMEASFIYEPTPDQQKAVIEVKSDMEKPYPMDRLLTGDVGFGKTEVAIRAAFKAVTDGKQVAVLVPTTLLAWQHYNSFKRRLRSFPITTEYISRGRTSKDIKDILLKLKNGEIDIIIGTHRLTSGDVEFKSLGLLIIDEEQKFGVATKERIRKTKVNVDTLTMSATPIPRTLQFSLMGARDLSNISTPPPNRYPVETISTRFSSENIREAIKFELSRNGQIFFVHNRVQNIEQIVTYISSIVPDAKVCCAHGQMKNSEMEKITTQFANHEYDVLVATTIIENGIDIPNANTIIINDAHKYGLSTLHQLRGRVGRGDRKAFCFLLTPPMAGLSDEARRRIQSIEDFSDLGSGIKIAIQDLDQRGAGNVLGAEQSGFVMSMGYETYQKVFEEAIKELKDSEFSDIQISNSKKNCTKYVVDTIFDTDLHLYLPSQYVPTDSERLLLYRELDNLSTEEEVLSFKSRLIDRFGQIPNNVDELILVPVLRTLAGRLGIEKLVLRNSMLSINLIQDETHYFYDSVEFYKLISYIKDNTNRCEISQRGDKKIIRIHNIAYISEAIELLKGILNMEMK